MRAAVHLALRPDRRFQPARDVSSAVAAEPTYMAKVLRKLTAAGILEAHRGPSGGVRLAVGMESTTVADLLRIVHASAKQGQCVFGWPGCSDRNPCPVHLVRKRTAAEDLDREISISLADITRLQARDPQEKPDTTTNGA